MAHAAATRAIETDAPADSILRTFIGALTWCRIFARHPNILPLALSHALATLAILVSFDEKITGRLRVGVSYFQLDF